MKYKGPRIRFPAVARTCEVCSAAFKIKPSQIANGGGKYCSRECSRPAIGKKNSLRAKANRIKKSCVVCNKEIAVKVSHEHIEGTYCSRACMTKGYQGRMVGRGNPNYRHGSCETRQYLNEYSRMSRTRRRGIPGGRIKHDAAKIWARQDGKCAACNAKLHPDDFDLDHITPIAKGGTNFEGNVRLLCPSCNGSKGAMTSAAFRHRVLRNQTEDSIQEAFFKWAHLMEWKHPELALMFHIPNGGFRDIRTAVKMKRAGVVAGVPDVFLACPSAGYSGLWLEFKAGRNNATTKQRIFMNRLKEVGYEVALVRSVDEGIAALRDYLGMKPE